ncbi:putative signal peptide and transmembrane protein [Rhodopirellula islandica]|uniref:Signal peptide and transmembrane protein n=1 Tax=Rhodopirellula islandica TaxID=595434 RepID=A0A0J1BB02_RHOIS|nr:hypothetical protein [Rhodopirellula islandica]KLU03713.1 putative signal peptide and transmembrane protein [Rhodopirellula islandica]
MIVRWLIGLSLGTLIIAATSPWFVRSYVPRQYDEVRQRVLLSPGESYRWRAEGYATTAIGPHGMMGRTNLPVATDSQSPRATVIALWGDSQAEGVCVPDPEKLWQQLQLDLRYQSGRDELARSPVQVLPLASSGDDVADWTAELPLSEAGFAVDEHVILLCEMVDMMGRQETPGGRAPVDSSQIARMNQVTRWVPDFVLHAGRNLVTDPDTLAPRRLRFGLGPIRCLEEPTRITLEDQVDRAAAERWIPDSLVSLRDATTKPLWIVYAPRCPVVMDGRLRWEDPDDLLWGIVQQHAAEQSIQVIDCRPAFRESVRRGVFPHGFQNGRIGNGHLNPVGYRLIAREFAKRWKAFPRGDRSLVNAGGPE